MVPLLTEMSPLSGRQFLGWATADSTSKAVFSSCMPYRVKGSRLLHLE